MAAQTAESGYRAPLKFVFTRTISLGIFFLLVGLIFVLDVPGTPLDLKLFEDIKPETETRLNFEAGIDPPGVTVPTYAYMIAVGLFYIYAGGIAVATSYSPGFEQAARWLITACGLLIIPTILIAAAADKETNATTMFSESLRLATPIALGAMAGLWTERSGVVNIAIEGMMLFGACFGFTALFLLQENYPDMNTDLILVIAVISALLAAGLASLIHAWLSITFKTDQIVSGTVINILALGVTSFVRREYLLSTRAGTITLPNIKIPLFSEIPIIGDALFNNKPIFYSMFIVIGLSHIMLFYTRWGLRVRAVGEHPHAADTLGINVNRTRWINVFIGGMIAGLAGAWLSVEETGRFTDNMTSGKGFIALAAMIFGKWTPLGSFLGALLFGFSQALGTRLQILEVDVPIQFLQMVPYVITIVVLAGLIGRARAPKAVGKPYEKE